MEILSIMLAASIAMTGCIGVAAADPWKDESGHGRWEKRYDHEDYRKHRKKHYKKYSRDYQRNYSHT